MTGRRIRAWRAFVADVHAGLLAARIDVDFFGVDDLRQLFDARYSAAMAIERALRIRLQQQLTSSDQAAPELDQPGADGGVQSPGQAGELSFGGGR